MLLQSDSGVPYELLAYIDKCPPIPHLPPPSPNQFLCTGTQKTWSEHRERLFAEIVFCFFK